MLNKPAVERLTLIFHFFVQSYVISLNSGYMSSFLLQHLSWLSILAERFPEYGIVSAKVKMRNEKPPNCSWLIPSSWHMDQVLSALWSGLASTVTSLSPKPPLTKGNHDNSVIFWPERKWRLKTTSQGLVCGNCKRLERSGKGASYIYSYNSHSILKGNDRLVHSNI